MHDGKLEDTEKPPLLYHWATQSQALSSICIAAQVVLSASVAHLVARWNTCEETWPSKGVDWGGLKWALSISLPTIMSYKVYFVWVMWGSLQVGGVDHVRGLLEVGVVMWEGISPPETVTIGMWYLIDKCRSLFHGLRLLDFLICILMLLSWKMYNFGIRSP